MHVVNEKFLEEFELVMLEIRVIREITKNSFREYLRLTMNF